MRDLVAAGFAPGPAAPDTGRMTAPVTVSVTRHVDPSQTTQMLAWMQAGTSMAEKFDGFLGSGWVRPSTDSTDWHMLYRFADAESLAAWEASPQRAWWLEAAQGSVEESRRERRTGIEGWFDEPTSIEATHTVPTPPRWKQMVVIFMVFLPLSLLANYVASHTIAGWPLVPRVVLVTTVMTPLMTYVFLPWITRRMGWWLHR